jgi:hypothetical protein
MRPLDAHPTGTRSCPHYCKRLSISNPYARRVRFGDSVGSTSNLRLFPTSRYTRLFVSRTPAHMAGANPTSRLLSTFPMPLRSQPFDSFHEEVLVPNVSTAIMSDFPIHISPHRRPTTAAHLTKTPAAPGPTDSNISYRAASLLRWHGAQDKTNVPRAVADLPHNRC